MGVHPVDKSQWYETVSMINTDTVCV